MSITIPWSIRREGHFDITDLEIDPARTGLLVVDVQRGYTERHLGVGLALDAFPDVRDYYYGRLESVVLPNIVRLIEVFRRHALEVVFTRQAFQMEDGRDVPAWNWRRQQIGTPGSPLFWSGSPEAELIEELAQPSDLLVDKASAGPFATSALDQYMRNLGIENVVVAGLLTNVAVETAARDAGDCGYNAIGVEDACVAYTELEHSESMNSASWWVAKSTSFVVDMLDGALGA